MKLVKDLLSCEGYRIIEGRRKGLDLVTFKDDEMLMIKVRGISLKI